MAKRATKKVNSNELDGKEFFAAIAQIEQEKGIKPGYMMEKITQALLSAYKKDHEGMGENLVIEANEETATVRLFLKKEVVEVVDDPATEISLDEADPIEGSYTFEVSSAGADRVLKKPDHFAQFLGAEVEVKLYRPRDGRKDHVGLLRAFEDGNVTLEVGGSPVDFEKKEIALVRLYPRF